MEGCTTVTRKPLFRPYTAVSGESSIKEGSTIVIKKRLKRLSSWPLQQFLDALPLRKAAQLSSGSVSFWPLLQFLEFFPLRKAAQASMLIGNYLDSLPDFFTANFVVDIAGTQNPKWKMN